MNPLTSTIQVVIAAGILNVWLLRFRKPSSWRGGSATSMKEEFAAYGLSVSFMRTVGFLKVSSALLLIAGLWLPVVTKPAAGTLAVLMLGAISMHVKVKDPARKSLPAFILFGLSLIVVFAS
ncbi:MAG: DoxX family protein [Elusimicrobia bacterium]|nr:DoxX family protein [Elusimicrobiota bacterium]MBP9699359.1 DoxX family protein [Elusimicrobiota bacterium]